MSQKNKMMQRKLLLLLIIIVMIPKYFGQRTPSSEVRDDLTAGSAYKLEGKALQVNIFLSVKGKPQWTNKKKEEMLALLPESKEWLNKELKKYNKSMDIVYKNYGINETISFNYTEIDKKNDEWHAAILKKMGYATPVDFYNTLKKEYKFDQMYIVFFINYEGHSYAMACSKDYEDDPNYFVEYIALFNNFEGTPITDKGEHYVIPHEILHLFGALDLYEGEDQTESSEKFAVKTIPKSIMLGSIRFLDEDEEQWELHQYEIDEFNAYLMGLHNKYKKWYDILSIKHYESQNK